MHGGLRPRSARMAEARRFANDPQTLIRVLTHASTSIQLVSWPLCGARRAPAGCSAAGTPEPNAGSRARGKNRARGRLTASLLNLRTDASPSTAEVFL